MIQAEGLKGLPAPTAADIKEHLNALRIGYIERNYRIKGSVSRIIVKSIEVDNGK